MQDRHVYLFLFRVKGFEVTEFDGFTTADSDVQSETGVFLCNIDSS